MVDELIINMLMDTAISRQTGPYYPNDIDFSIKDSIQHMFITEEERILYVENKMRDFERKGKVAECHGMYKTL